MFLELCSGILTKLWSAVSSVVQQEVSAFVLPRGEELGRLSPLQAADEKKNTVAVDLAVVSLVPLDGIFTCKGTTKTCTKGLFGWER